MVRLTVFINKLRIRIDISTTEKQWNLGIFRTRIPLILYPCSNASMPQNEYEYEAYSPCAMVTRLIGINLINCLALI